MTCQNESAPIIEPDIDMSDFVLQDGFEIALVASEPLIEAPIAMSFDNEGRLWVLEMPDYMPNIDGAFEDEPRGRIVILEDQNGNGRMDKAKVFLEGLSQPRALAHVYGGLLYAEAPNLWFVDIINDEPANPVLVDSTYAVGGNVEHQPNGLLMNIDNWIYNAKSNFRYRRVDGVWQKEPTTFRGQWGITKNNQGHLFYNDNSNPLYGDYLMPGQITRNPYQHTKAGESQLICKDRRLFPLQATAVNRGYLDGMLDKDDKLLNFTSACGPVIYRGGAWDDVYNAAFVCAPEANLIKRIKLSYDSNGTIGTYAYDSTEFLATMDEGFRPVNLNNAPDGDLYITDFHRGIIQHKVYMTAYLKKQIEDKQLDTIVGAGRIYRVYKKDKQKDFLNLNKFDTKALCYALSSPNGWIRDRAQQLLIAQRDQRAIPILKTIAINPEEYLPALHAFWALEGLKALDFETAKKAINAHKKRVLNVDYQVFSRFEETHSTELFEFYEYELSNTNRLAIASLAMSISECESTNQSFPLLKRIAEGNPDDALISEAIISGLAEKEADFLDFIDSVKNDLLKEKLQQTIDNRKNDKLYYIYKMTKIGEDDKTVGRQLFNIHCASCHGIGGEGNALLAPSLLEADLVEMDAQVVASIILHGLQGPITQANQSKTYNAAMPGLKDNPTLNDADIAAITAYVKNAFSLSPQGIPIEKVAQLRASQPASAMWTEAELKALYE